MVPTVEEKPRALEEWSGLFGRPDLRRCRTTGAPECRASWRRAQECIWPRVSGPVYLANDIEALESGRCALIAEDFFASAGSVEDGAAPRPSASSAMMTLGPGRRRGSPGASTQRRRGSEPRGRPPLCAMAERAVPRARRSSAPTGSVQAAAHRDAGPIFAAALRWKRLRASVRRVGPVTNIERTPNGVELDEDVVISESREARARRVERRCDPCRTQPRVRGEREDLAFRLPGRIEGRRSLCDQRELQPQRQRLCL